MINKLKRFGKKTTKFAKPALIIIGVIAIMWAAMSLTRPPKDYGASYSGFLKNVAGGGVKRVEVTGADIHAFTKDGEDYTVRDPGDSQLINELIKNNVEIKSVPRQQNLLMDIFVSWFPTLLLLFAFWFFMWRRGSSGGPGGFKKNPAKLIEVAGKVTFSDVAGIDESKLEVSEFVDFLKDPAKFKKLGGRMPRGALLVGPPGTGKTLLARAVAGEADVPFFTVAGPDFVEMFVGVGASRVRDMFEEAKKRAPCIIFIDEIDAVGRHRGQSPVPGAGGETENTLNQLLVEMDGFETDTGIIIIAATNRADVLDPALLRPGRFDRQIYVNLPDVIGREQILDVHIKKVDYSDDVSTKDLARGTPGFSGADLANLVNEAALYAARLGADAVDMKHFEFAKDKILMGAEKKTLSMTKEERRLTAYHEAGHAVVGWTLSGEDEHDPLYKVSIMPRGRALGITMFLPENDPVSASKTKLESQISSLYAGRIAEHMTVGATKITTGASNDIERATDLATRMVTEWGLADKLLPLKFSKEQSWGGIKQIISEETKLAIESEINTIITRNYERAEHILKANSRRMHLMAEALLEHETIDLDIIKSIMEDEELNERRLSLQTVE